MSKEDNLRALAARIGCYRLHATHDSRLVTEPARRGFMAKFAREVDPEGVLSSEERSRRATAALKAHMARLAYRSAQARRSQARR